MDMNQFRKHLARTSKKNKQIIIEQDVLKGTKTPVSFSTGVQCTVIGKGDIGFDEFTKKKVTSKVKPGTKFSASSTDDVLAKLKCEKHQIQPDQLKAIKAGAKKLYVFVDPFHAQENGERVVQIFANESKAKEWYDESSNVGSEPSDYDWSPTEY